MGNCCGSPEVTEGTFDRDGDTSYPATVAAFRLDAYEVTVGRFRKFVAASAAGWVPANGAGIHTHLNTGLGLVNSGTGGGYEPGWQTSWTSHLATTTSAWTTNLSCDGPSETWTSSATASDDLPINCMDWYEAYAFCIWDGGFLPSEAEYNYAFMAGNAEQTYPWGSTVPGANASLSVYGCYYPSGANGTCSGIQNIAPVGSVTAGNGKWGQSDLAGDVFQWVLDWYERPYTTSSCIDCADTTDTNSANRSIRGGGFSVNSSFLLASNRLYDPLTYRGSGVGFRCARTP